ncbi:hypothetical protein SAMN05877809_1162 [Rhodobacter sp. JA431]|uniref:hypothetical protein n=1 Tax=Rhodobacter sp. JA431 TaxID=570013 RepID=UPI000BCAD8A4|nr:hypothetical protein [Rhodobacter sp. JA431]SOC21403.1 hypothetical protein SAMN05877809_1162 [Rhodobacter sp. JA431]
MTKTLTAMAMGLMLIAGTAHAAQTDADQDGVPDMAEPLLHTDPQNPDTDGDGANDLADKAPTFAQSPITAGGTVPSFHIGELLVENNIDPVAHKDAPDHLEIEVVNDGPTPLSGFTLYTTLTDNDTGAQEATIYHPTVTVPAGGAARIHVDASGAPDHLRANPNSIYVTSQSAKVMTVTLQLPGQAAVTASVNKDAGGAEQAD